MSTSIPKLSRLTQSIWRVLGCNPSPMTLQGTNLYLVGKGGSRILVDAGPTEVPEFVGNMRKLLLEQKTKVDQLVLTHWHLDHTAGLKDLIPVFKEVNDGKFPCVYKFPRTDQPDNPIPKEYPFQELKAGQLIKTDGVTLKVHYTPGHTTDHASFHYVEENSVFCGDCLLGEGTGIFDDLSDYMKTLNSILKMKSSAIYCGHGPVITNPTASIKYNMDHQNAREKRIYRFLDENAPKALTVSDIANNMYKGFSSTLQKQAAVSIQLHLNKLRQEHKVQYANGRYSINKFAM